MIYNWDYQIIIDDLLFLDMEDSSVTESETSLQVLSFEESSDSEIERVSSREYRLWVRRGKLSCKHYL